MFKIIKRMTVLSSLLVLSWSCEVIESNYTSRSSYSGLIYFGQTLISESSEASVSLLRILSISEEAINEDGFTYTTYIADNQTLDIVRVADNCWDVTGAGETTNFTVQVLRELSDNLEDEYKWTISSFSLDYDESNGYTAIMTTDGDIVYEWYESTSSMSKSWELLQTGTYYLQTYISDADADRYIFRYDEGDFRAETYTVTTL